LLKRAGNRLIGIFPRLSVNLRLPPEQVAKVLGEAVLCCDLLQHVGINAAIESLRDLDLVAVCLDGCAALRLRDGKRSDQSVLDLAAPLYRCALSLFCVERQVKKNHAAPPILRIISPISDASHASSLPERSFAVQRPSGWHMMARCVTPSASFSTRNASTRSKKYGRDCPTFAPGILGLRSEERRVGK